MNKVAPIAMFLGDLIVIVISTLLLVFRSSYEPKPIFDVSIAIIPFLSTWIVLAQIGDAYNLSLPVREFLKRNILLWVASIFIAQIIRFVLKYFASRTISNALWIFMEAIGISILFIFWKCNSYLLYKISSQPEKQMAKRVISSLVLVIFIVVILSIIPFIYSVITYSEHIYSVVNSPAAEAALVLGAGLWPDGTPSTAMVERVRASKDLYEMGRIRYIVFSGSRQETEAMLQLAETFGLDRNILLSDIFGESTLDSCSNMIHDFDFSNIAVVSQKYHLFRALYFCDSMGIQSIGIHPDSETPLPETMMRGYLREVIATAAGFFEIQTMCVKKIDADCVE